MIGEMATLHDPLTGSTAVTRQPFPGNATSLQERDPEAVRRHDLTGDSGMNDPHRWYAYPTPLGWIMFPADISRWETRQHACGTDPTDVIEGSVHLTVEARMPGLPSALADVADLADPAEAA